MPGDEKELSIPGPAEAAGVARVLRLAAGKDEGHVRLGDSRRLLLWVPVRGSPSAVCPVPEQLRSCTPRLGEQGW